MSNLDKIANQRSSSKQMLLALDRAVAKLEAVERSKSEPIAIIGMGCRFPGGANDPKTFWRLLCDGTDAIKSIPSQRWDIDAYYDPNPNTQGKMYIRQAGLLSQVDQFDPQFFGISPRETISLDPQQRLMLEVSWEALENAGQAPNELKDSQTGVFVGIGQNDYAQLQLNDGDIKYINPYDGTGNGFCFASGRLSYFLGLQGPCLAVDTACSSSLVAVHLACQSLRSRECNLALAGGVQLILSPVVTTALCKMKALSSDGRCKTFDAAADGYGRGEGCGVIVLKRLSDAITDGNPILATIRGSAMNHDGASSGLTVPNKLAQEKLINQTLAAAKVDPSQVSYIEAHGTGTSLGDPIEVRALAAVLGTGRSSENPLMIGSVKTNIGHLEAAAGIAGLMKVVLQLQHKKIAPHLHFKQPNPYINWEELPVVVPTQLIQWSSGSKGRLAGVSSFGFGGTNAHVILEEAPVPLTSQKSKVKIFDLEERPSHLLTLSAKCKQALRELAHRYHEFLGDNSTAASIADICFTANTGRTHFNHRLAIIASDQQELATKLAKISAGEEFEKFNQVFSGKLSSNRKSPKIAFLFTGQGSQSIDMGRQLYETQPVFRQALEQCDRLLQPYIEKSILEIIYPQNTQESNNYLINQTAYTQPALFAIEYALFQLWQSWGIQPDVVMGHSVGEYVAATVSGVFSLEDGLKLIAHRGRLMQDLPSGGEMVAVMASEEKVNQLIAPYRNKVALAAINGPKSAVISGATATIDTVRDSLESQGIKTKQLQVSHAFHSPLIEPMLAGFEAVANQITYHQPSIPLISNVTGVRADENIATASYWVHHVRQPVKFAQSMETLHQEGYEVFLEIGPKPILLGMARQCLPEGVGLWLPSLRPGQSDWQQMLQSLAKLYVRGVKVDWLGFDGDYFRSKVVLPTYPFQRQRYWIDNADKKSPKDTYAFSEHKTTSIVDWLNEGNTQQLAQQLEKVGKFSSEQVNLLPEFLEILVQQHQTQLTAATIQDWFYQVQWKPLLDNQPKTSIQPSHWLIFADTTAVGENLAQQLQQQGCECSLVYRGVRYQKLTKGAYQLNPTEPQEFEQLIQDIGENSKLPLQKVIHLWSLDAPASKDLTVTSLEQAQIWGCGTILHLVKALIKINNILQLWLVTRGAQSIQSTTEEVSVAASPLWGMGRVMSLEYPQFWGGMVDLDPQTPESETETLLKLLTNNNQLEDHLALRGKKTYVARLVKQSPTVFQPVSLKSDATYLITGGLGALGLQTANWMVEKGARHLVLIGRKQPSEDKLAVISNLQQQGAEVVVVQADVCHFEELSKIFEQVDSHQAPLKGIVHAAGIGASQAMEQIELTQLEELMAAKVLGGWILHQLTQDKKLDFFVSFSSIAAVWGSAGQAHYAASNHFLDGLTHYRRAKGLPSFSINWGPWSGGGLAGEQELEELSKRGVEPLSPEQGISALDRLWLSDSCQTTVANVNWSLFKQLYEIGKRRLLLEEIEVEPLETQLPNSQQKAKPINTKQQSGISQRLQAASVSERHSLLVAYLQGEFANVLGLSQSQLPEPQTNLFELGMDSLMYLEIVNLIRSQFHVEFSFIELLQASSIDGVAELMLKKLALNVSDVDVTANILNLHEEAILDESINPDAERVAPTETRRIFLTGASGFLGAFLLDELLEQTDADVYCLIRATDDQSGMLKLRKNLKSYELWKEKYNERIIPVLGDLSQPLLGLSAEKFEQMGKQIDAIYHSAAILNFVYPFSVLKSTNVLGTQEILRLACQFKVKPLHYVSTDAVFDSCGYYGKVVKESEPIIHTEAIDLGYTQTKWVAEKLVTNARERGLPVAIYRPPLIAGDSRTGFWNTDDFSCRFLKGCIQMGSMPNIDCEVTFVPVDYVSRAIVFLSQQKESLGQAFHLNNPNHSTWRSVARWIDTFGYPLRLIPYQQWESELMETSGSRNDNILSSLLPFFLRRWSKEQLTFSELAQSRAKLNCEETVARLANTSIVCPSVDSKLLDTYFSYFNRSGFLEPAAVCINDNQLIATVNS